MNPPFIVTEDDFFSSEGENYSDYIEEDDDELCEPIIHFKKTQEITPRLSTCEIEAIENKKKFQKDVDDLLKKNIILNIFEDMYLSFGICHNISQEYQDIYGIEDENIDIILNFEKGYLKCMPEITINNAGFLSWQLKNCIQLFYETLFHKHDKVKNSLVLLFDRLQDRINNPGKFCVICDCEQDYYSIKPISCSKPLCYFQFTELSISCYSRDYNDKLVHSFIDIMINKKDVFELIYNFAYSASVSARKEKVFDQIPQKLVERGDVYQIISKILKEVPPLDELLQYDEKTIIEQLNIIDTDAFYLLKWLYLTVSCYLDNIDSKSDEFKNIIKDYKLNGCGSVSKIFRYVSNPPERDFNFRKNEKIKNVKKLMLYHGSPTDNWYSILKKSLVNYSGTSNQLHGAAYGNGIYFAYEPQVSLDYSRAFGSARTSGHRACLAICEVLDDGSNKIVSRTPHFVMSDENFVKTKYLVLFN